MIRNLNWSCHICGKKINKQGSGPHLAMHRKRGDLEQKSLEQKSASLLKEPSHGSQIKHPKIPPHLSGYALGFIRCWLSVYAGSHRLPLPDLEHELGEILRTTEGWPVLGPED